MFFINFQIYLSHSQGEYRNWYFLKTFTLEIFQILNSSNKNVISAFLKLKDGFPEIKNVAEFKEFETFHAQLKPVFGGFETRLKFIKFRLWQCSWNKNLCSWNQNCSFSDIKIAVFIKDWDSHVPELQTAVIPKIQISIWYHEIKMTVFQKSKWRFS